MMSACMRATLEPDRTVTSSQTVTRTLTTDERPTLLFSDRFHHRTWMKRKQIWYNRVAKARAYAQRARRERCTDLLAIYMYP